MRVTETMNLDQLVAGMLVAKAVLDEGGRVLVPAGAEISESLLHGLERRGIGQVTVSHEVAEDPAEREARQVRVSAQLEHLFRKAGEGEATRQLEQAIMAFRMGGKQ